MNAQSLNAQAFIESLYQAVDARNPERLAEFLHPEVNFHFANADVIQGKSEVLEANRSFFSSIIYFRTGPSFFFIWSWSRDTTESFGLRLMNCFFV